MNRLIKRMRSPASTLSDSDLLAITRYFGGELTPEEAARLEQRSRTDAELFRELRFIHQAFLQVEQGDHDEALFSFDDSTTARRVPRRERWLIGSSALFLVLLLVYAVTTRLNKAATVKRDRTEDRASTVDFRDRVTVDATQRDTSLGFQLMDVRLRRGSRLTYGFQGRNAGGSGVLALDGEAAFHSWAAGMFIRTATSVVHVLAGRYAIRSNPNDGVTLVTVDSGLAWIEPAGTDTLGASLHQPFEVVRPGERAIMTRDGAVAVIKRGVGFPVSAFKAPVGTLENDSSPEQLTARSSYELVTLTTLDRHGTRR